MLESFRRAFITFSHVDLQQMHMHLMRHFLCAYWARMQTSHYALGEPGIGLPSVTQKRRFECSATASRLRRRLAQSDTRTERWASRCANMIARDNPSEQEIQTNLGQALNSTKNSSIHTKLFLRTGQHSFECLGELANFSSSKALFRHIQVVF